MNELNGVGLAEQLKTNKWPNKEFCQRNVRTSLCWTNKHEGLTNLKVVEVHTNSNMDK